MNCTRSTNATGAPAPEAAPVLDAERLDVYRVARGSALECAAIIDVLLVRRLAPAADCRRVRSLLVRIVQMLTSLDGSLG